MSPSRKDRIEGGIWGLLVGDALGVPYEFHRPEHVPPLAEIELTPPPGYHRAHRSVPPGTFSDDGAQALCLLASLVERGRLDPEDLARKLVAWWQEGYLAVDGIVFDIGITTGAALRAIAAGTPALEAGPRAVESNGNGSLMRVLPLALWHSGDDAALVADAHAQSLVTHGHARSQASCAFYCLWARRVLEGAETEAAWRDAARSLRGIYAGFPEHHEELEAEIRPDDPPGGTGKGYVVDTLRSARLVCLQPSYEAVVKAAVALGHDTDTTACVAGGIAGLRGGASGIPARWLSALRGRELVEPLLEGLLR